MYVVGMATCPTCSGTFFDATFCPRDGALLIDELDSGVVLDDRYRLIRQVGAGAMGIVFEAEHLHLHRRVAVTILKHEYAKDLQVVKRLEREAQTTSDLGHPNIVQCRDFGYARDGRVYMVMEWLDGETLEARLAREGVDLAVAVDIAIQTCAGLAEAHAHDVIHRDLKPAKLFLAHDREGVLRVKILDFGIAKLVEQQLELTATGVVIGTPNYMSPEQSNGERVDGRADLYSLGVNLYEMVTGSVPFHGDSTLAVLHQHSVRKPVAPSESAPDRAIPPELERIVMRCLEKATCRPLPVGYRAPRGARAHSRRGHGVAIAGGRRFEYRTAGIHVCARLLGAGDRPGFRGRSTRTRCAKSRVDRRCRDNCGGWNCRRDPGARTIGVMAATSIDDRHDVSMTMSIGLHAFPFDGGT